MDYFAKSGMPTRQRTDCAIVGVYESGELSEPGMALDKASKGLLAKAVRAGDASGKLGGVHMLNPVPGLNCKRILMVGCGPREGYSGKTYRKVLADAAARLKGSGARDAVSFIAPDGTNGADLEALASLSVLTMEDALYTFDQLKSRNNTATPALKRFAFAVDGPPARRSALRGIDYGQAVAAGVNLARDLGNMPSNICTPSYLARAARDMARGQGRLSSKSLGEAEMRKLGMNAFLSVTNGSREPAKLIVMQYRGKPGGKRPIVLVGKGITFDTGGISIKPPTNMDEMKFDMCGAAGVLGTMLSINRLGLPINVVGIVPTCENMPDGRATRPGDIVKTMSGRTVEILNTDAEGRLILCDALTYARRFKPRRVIDVATLTGACVIALGAHFSGLMSNDDELAEQLLEAGVQAGDRAWHLPISEEYGEQLKSNFADLANVGGRAGGAITAACFLSNFTENLSWAHLDIAGTAWRSGTQKGGTGRPVPLLVQYLKNHG